MSLVPKSNDVDPWESRRPRWFDWDTFGLGITPQEIQSFFEFPRQRFDNFFKQFGDLTPVTFGKDGFQACVDVKQFNPNEITVKTVDNNVVIEGKHEERKDDHGFVSRHFVRKYALPRGYDASQVVSSLSSDGVLTVKAPPPQGPIESNERVVQIEHTGPSNLNIKNTQEQSKKKRK